MTQPPALLIRGARAYDAAGDVHQPALADVLIRGSTIAAVGAGVQAALARHDGALRTLEARDRLLVPGFVNAHYHSYDVLAKGMFEDVPLEVWRQCTGRMGAHRSPDEVRLRTLLGAVECLRNGITCVQDMNILAPYDDALVDAIVEAYEKVGIRTVLSFSARDLSDAATIPCLAETAPTDLLRLVGNRDANAREVMDFVESQVRRHRRSDDMLIWALSPSAPQRCTPALLEIMRETSERHGLPVYTHLYEAKAHAVHARQRYTADGGSLVRYLDRHGLLNRRLSVAHCLWATRAEMDLLAERGVTAVVNAVSNLKLKDGVPPINEFRRAGLRLAFGCDCASSSDVQSAFQAMKLACLLAAAEGPEPGCLSAAQAIEVATRGGAATAGLDDTIGAIRPGMKADLLLLDLRDPSFVPFNSAARQMVFSETGRALETVIVNGRLVMHERRILTVDEDSLQRELAERLPAYRAEFVEMLRACEPLARAFREQARRVDALDVGVERYFRTSPSLPS